jgi:hypothetical protein
LTAVRADPHVASALPVGYASTTGLQHTQAETTKPTPS